MRTTSFLTGSLIALALATPSLAGDFADYEKDMRNAYGSYRAALFMTSTGKAEESTKAVQKFSVAWGELTAGDPPPQYVDDEGYRGTVSAVGSIAATAAEEIAAGKLTEAHETLEDIRDEISDLRIRNGLYGFSDRMNAYHARMEDVLAKPDMPPAEAVEEAAVLVYLTMEIHKNPPTDANDEFLSLMSAFEDSVYNFKNAAESGDAAAIKAAIGGLKPPYSKLFLKFG